MIKNKFTSSSKPGEFHINNLCCLIYTPANVIFNSNHHYFRSSDFISIEPWKKNQLPWEPVQPSHQIEMSLDY